MRDSAQSFGEQAARFSLYAPVAVLVVGCLGRGSRGEPGVAIALFGLNVLLLVSGLVLGVVALVSMRFGRERIFGRAVAGVVLNGLAVALLASVMLPMVRAGDAKAKVAGRWRVQSPADPSIRQIDLAFNPDGTFTLTSLRNDDASATLKGTWVFTRTKLIGVTVTDAGTGDPSVVGRKIGLGTVKSIDDRRMVLTTDKGEEAYDRRP